MAQTFNAPALPVPLFSWTTLMDDLIPLLMLLPLAALLALILGVIAFFRVQNLEDKVHTLELKLKALQARAPAAEAKPESQAASAEQGTEAVAEAAAETPAPVAAMASAAPREPVSFEALFGERVTVRPQGPSLVDRLLENAKQHWMIWLGGICVGLAGVFMVRYSIEQGLLGPEARILLSLLAGAGLHAGAEWLRRTRGQNPVFASLAGGASIILYAALLAAFRLLPDTSPTLIFAAMALVSFATMALSLKHGPVLAALGMLGGYLVPALVNTGSGNIAAALVYTGILTFFSLWLLAYVQRRWLWLGVIAGSLLWWLISLDVQPADGVRSLYLLALAYGFLAVPRFDWFLRPAAFEPEHNWWQRLLALRNTASDWPVFPALLLLVLAQGATLAIENAALAGYFSWLALPGLLLLAASRRPELNPLPAIMLVLSVLASVCPLLVEQGDQWLLGPVDIASQTALAARFALLTLVFCAACYWVLFSKPEYPAFWTGLGVATPLLMLAVSYYLFPDFRLDWAWGLVALLLGLSYLWLGEREQSNQARPLISVILISAGHMGLALAAVIWLAEATLTLALAAQLVSLALLQQRYQLALMSWVIRAVLLLVVIRLTLNPWLLTYDSASHWSLWTYGGATVCTALAAWILRGESRMQPWLQGGAAQLLVLTLATEVRYWLYDGDIFRHQFSFTEASIDVVLWGSAAVIYFWRATQVTQWPRFYQVLGALHLGAAALVYAGVLLLLENPLWSYTPVSDTPVFNLLLLSFGLPTVIMAALWRVLPAQYKRYAALATGLNLLWFVSLEIRHLWQGGAGMSLGNDTPDGELYTYSVVWLLMAAAALSLGSWLGKRDLYRAGMALLLVVVAKLFLVDMAGLTGLWRVASFMGLGLTLLALAWLHQKFGGRLEQASDA
ncbi:DUF2339 domain-containing protein [Thalassolituus sp. LLYu03]|uniref:DUF2339 domain-containing protein n=1 Tax=Thalassolituus sp. LLYu03 TaxID=3421656 RepID=UPI003D2B7FAC